MAALTSQIVPSRVVVLLGGKSVEREISLESGAAVSAALASRGHEVVEVDPAKTNLDRFVWYPTDVAFIALHGTYGEDGQVQRLLETLGIPFTGSNSAASELAFSKSAAKERMTQGNVLTPPSAVIHKRDSQSRCAMHARNLVYPVVVKPDRQGSSVGVTIVADESGLAAAVQRCFEFGEFGLIEGFVEGEEWTVGMIGGTPLPPLRIATPRDFYDYQAKYHATTTNYEVCPEDEPELAATLQFVARRACRALGVTGVSRVDLRVDADGVPWVLEINTVPGMTAHSLIPKAAAHVGWDFADVCEQSLRLCHFPLRQRRAA